jgi:hypothetical protein
MNLLPAIDPAPKAAEDLMRLRRLSFDVRKASSSLRSITISPASFQNVSQKFEAQIL